MAEYICINFLVTGQVQGVFFRDSARTKALELGVSGWIKNSPNGQQVEGQACGEPAKVEAFYQWLHQGPPRAVVTEVIRENIPQEKHASFDVKK